MSRNSPCVTAPHGFSRLPLTFAYPPHSNSTDDMKSALVFLGLVGCALAQSVAIFAPAANAPVAAGSDLVVDVEKKVSIIAFYIPCYSDDATNVAWAFWHHQRFRRHRFDAVQRGLLCYYHHRRYWSGAFQGQLRPADRSRQRVKCRLPELYGDHPVGDAQGSCVAQYWTLLLGRGMCLLSWN